MADYLIQRHIPNAPNSTNGAWVDEGIARDLKADEAQLAVAQTVVPPLDTRRRAIRWDTTEEFDLIPGPPHIEKATKEQPNEPKPARGVGGVP